MTEWALGQGVMANAWYAIVDAAWPAFLAKSALTRQPDAQPAA